MEEYAIEFRDVSKIYKLIGKDKKKSEDKKFYALKQINFKISKGEVVGILGTNGSGKSTMATILAGISEIDEGEMIVNGEQALMAYPGKYTVKRLYANKDRVGVEIVRKTVILNDTNEDWVKDTERETGNEISFF